MPSIPHFSPWLIAATAMVTIACSSTGWSAEVIRLDEKNWDDAAPQGKEVDCIYGDWVMRNGRIVAVIGAAVEGRNANMTTRNVGGSVIDLTERERQSDQLTAYYPLGGAYKLVGPLRPEDSEEPTTSGKNVSLLFRGPSDDGRTMGTVIYQLSDDSPWLKITTRVSSTAAGVNELEVADSIRADGEFQFGQDAELGVFWAYDPYWRQAYGMMLESKDLQFTVGELKRRARPSLRIENKGAAGGKLAADVAGEIVRYVFPAAHTTEALALASDLRGKSLVKVNLKVRDPSGPVDGANVTVKSAEGEPYAHGRTDENGRLVARVPAGKHPVVIEALGRGEKAMEWDLMSDRPEEVALAAPGYVVAEIGEAGNPEPCKVQFIGRDGTKDPNFGPDSAVHGVRNAYYSENGKFRTAIAPGSYDVIVSHGPEFDAVFTTIKVTAGEDTKLAAELKRTVDTSGWLSADFHSHSTPSGDNTSSQRGRVLNLLAEHVEFIPCTEHNRLTVYDEHLQHFKAVDRVLTCPGIELTNEPGSVNHQNAFPMVNKPRTQNGGGPVTDADPVVQIERLAMWDAGSEKLVQLNHPNLVQVVGDKDVDGSPDGGFEKMFRFMDVVEVHPLDRIFKKPDSLPNARETGATVFHWLQLMNLGYRVPGVVNTDAHWNFHGSGFLRNYIKSETDDPAKAEVSEIVHTCEHGTLMLTNGPFMEVKATADEDGQSANVGDDLKAPGGKLHVKVRVQCPNWFEVNRVQVFVNGDPLSKWNFTQRTHAGMFHGATVVFDENLAIELEKDAHLVVACAGEGKQMGAVMGPDHGKDMPIAVGNPIFVDVDGDGFEPNGDLLGLPLPVEPGLKPSKGHHHD